MNLLFRLFWKLLSLPFRPRLSFLDASVIHLRVWPTDLDLNFHMNNGRYLTVMDLGVSANQVVHPRSGKLKSPNNSYQGASGEPPQFSKVLPRQSSINGESHPGRGLDRRRCG